MAFSPSSSAKVRLLSIGFAVAVHAVVGVSVFTSRSTEGRSVRPVVFDVILLAPAGDPIGEEPARIETAPTPEFRVQSAASASPSPPEVAVTPVVPTSSASWTPTSLVRLDAGLDTGPSAPEGGASAPRDGGRREAEPASPPAASATPAGEVDPYPRIVARALEREKAYPARASGLRLAGEAVIELTVDRTGGLRRLRLTRSSGHALLDQAALRTARDAAPFPRPERPTWSRRTFEIPLKFEPRSSG